MAGRHQADYGPPSRLHQHWTIDDSNNTGDSHTSALPRPTKKEFTIFIRILEMEDEATQKIFTNQPGCFPKKSSCGNQSIMVLTESISNTILIEVVKNRTAGKMIQAYQTLIDQLRTTSIVPKLHILDNECTQDFKDTIHLKKYARRYLSYLPISYVLAERVEYIKDTFGQARHQKLERRAGRTLCTPCSLVSRSHAQCTHQNHSFF
jgi:hypothetical protein